MTDKLQAQVMGTSIELKRSQWGGRAAYISNYPGLLEQVQQYTWTYSNRYLRCGKLNKSLHWFVLAFLYGADKLDTMLEHSKIVEHLENDGLNCRYENLHIVTSDYNKAKAFTIDKIEQSILPVYIIDVFYNHEKRYYQMQIMFNYNMFWDLSTHIPIEAFAAQYEKFEDLYLDWLYVLRLKGQVFSLQKFHCDHLYFKDRPSLSLRPGEENNTIVERDGEFYLRLSLDPEKRFAYMVKTSYQEIGE